MKANINFIRFRWPAIIFSTVLILIGLWMIYGPHNVNLGIFTPKGFNLGVDFKGGLVQQITVYSGIHQDDVRSFAEKAGLGNDVQQIIVPAEKQIGKATTYLIRTMISDKEQKEMQEKNLTAANYFENKTKDFYALIKQKTNQDTYVLTGEELKKANNLFKNDPIHGELADQRTDTQRVLDNVARDSESVTSSSYAQTLQKQALILVSLALLIIFLYVLFRFNYKFAIGGIFATLHDTLVMTGFIAFFQLELDMTLIAALLTLIGYSINDTIVIFDRVRENYTVMKDLSPRKIFNSSINQTLSRTIVTSTVTLTSVIALLIWAGPKIFGFSLVLSVGIAFGTYSSIFIAAPVVDLWESLFNKKEKERAIKEKKKDEEIKIKNENQTETVDNNEDETTNENITISNLSKSKLKKLSGKIKK
jgi:preprotein translocase SecF subunit